MKKIFFGSLFSIIAANAANAATPWWQQPTVCRLDPTNCYVSMGAGYDSGMWDATGQCWGLKLICPDAMRQPQSDPVPMGRGDIANGTKLNQDFDINVLNNDCFGVRKTTANGTMASVNGKYVNVWCNGILDNPDETLTTGEITFGAQPTCAALAENGYVGVVNNRCYGKYYDTAQYYIECDGADIMPSRLIVLNGADYTLPMGNAPTDKTAAEKIFDKMESVSQTQRAKYFQDN